MPQKRTIWQEVVKDLRTRVNKSEIETWIFPAALKELDDASVVLSVPNRFFATWIEERYLAHIKDSFSRILKKAPSVSFHFSEKTLADESPKDFQTHYGIDPSKTFDSYFVAKWNQFAFSSASEFSGTEECPYNPLYIFSNTGLGKTHLLHAIANRLLEKHPDASVRYVDAIAFTSEFIHSWRNDQQESFRQRYFNLDVILFDDVHILSNRHKTQHAFLSLFDNLKSLNRKMVITGDKAPRELPNMNAALKSRLGAGLIAEIQPPDQAAILSVTKRKAKDVGAHLPEDVIFFLSHTSTDIHGLLKNMVKLESYSSLTGRGINLSTAKSLVRSAGRDGANIEDIKVITAGYFNISPKDLLSGKKKRTHSYPRQIAMYLARKHTGLSFKQIGEAFGQRDHSTVIYAIRRVEKTREAQGPVTDDLARIENLLC